MYMYVVEECTVHVLVQYVDRFMGESAGRSKIEGTGICESYTALFRALLAWWPVVTVAVVRGLRTDCALEICTINSAE